MKYSDEAKHAAKKIIDCKIPKCIKDNSFYPKLKYDTMEYYEALFDFAHCILNGVELSSSFSYTLIDEEFVALLREKKNEHKFYDEVIIFLEVIKEHIIGIRNVN